MVEHMEDVHTTYHKRPIKALSSSFENHLWIAARCNTSHCSAEGGVGTVGSCMEKALIGAGIDVALR